MYHKVAIENSPLQAYVSALMFSPARSLVRGLFRHEEPKTMRIRPVIRDEWSACLQTLEGHSGPARSVAFSGDSTQLASASADSTVKVWDAGSSKCLQTLEGHGGPVRSVAFSGDSTRLASASDDSTVKVWDASSGKCLQTLAIRKVLFNISFSAAGSCLHTEIGAIVIDASSALCITSNVTKPQGPRYQGGGLSSDGAWITYNSENLIWLPSEYRPSCSAVSAKTVSIGVGSGKVWMCNFNVENS
jgi:WD40 repeat protein